MNGRSREKAFLGVGWAFPPQLAADDTLSEVGYEEDVHQAIHIILGTNPGERVMRPDFGAGLTDFLYEPISTAALVLIQKRVRDALIDWEPRIDVLSVNTVPRTREGIILIEITYRIRATNTQVNLVYPFYLEEGASS